jgi:hypothetical protein
LESVVFAKKFYMRFFFRLYRYVLGSWKLRYSQRFYTKNN